MARGHFGSSPREHNADVVDFTALLEAEKERRGDGGTIERLKLRYDEKADHYFGRPAVELTDGEPLYLLGAAISAHSEADATPAKHRTAQRRMHEAPR